MKIKTFLLKNKRIPLKILLVLICIYGLYFRFNLRASFELHNDEYNQLKTMQGSFLEMLRVLPQNELNAYLNGDHFIIYPFFKVFSYNKWGLAIPHIFTTILSFILLYILCAKYLKVTWSYIIPFIIVCFNYTMARYATMVRGYAVIPALALTSFLLWYHINEKFKNNLILDFRLKLIFGACFILIILFHSYGILMFLMPLLYFWLLRVDEGTGASFIRKNLKFILLILLLSVPLWLYSVFGPNVKVGSSGWNPFQFIADPRFNLPGFLKDVFGNLVGDRKLYFLLVGILFPIFCSYPDRIKQLLFLFIMVLFPILLILLMDCLTPYWFLQRQFIWVMPFFALFLGWAWESFIICLFRKFKKH